MLICTFGLHKKVSLIKKCGQKISFHEMKKLMVKLIKIFYAAERERVSSNKVTISVHE